jgi:hypothetical protein
VRPSCQLAARPSRQGATESAGWSTRRCLAQIGLQSVFHDPVERTSQSLPLRRIGSFATRRHARPIFGYLLLRHPGLPRHAWSWSQPPQSFGEQRDRRKICSGRRPRELRASCTRIGGHCPRLGTSRAPLDRAAHSHHSKQPAETVTQLCALLATRCLRVTRGTPSQSVQLFSEKAIHLQPFMLPQPEALPPRSHFRQSVGLGALTAARQSANYRARLAQT